LYFFGTHSSRRFRGQRKNYVQYLLAASNLTRAAAKLLEMRRQEYNTIGRRTTIVLASLLVLIATTVQAAHSCEPAAPTPQAHFQGASVAVGHDAICRLCSGSGSTLLTSPIIQGFPILAAAQPEHTPNLVLPRQAQSYALQMRPPPLA
jgi:hypothetical protein